MSMHDLVLKNRTCRRFHQEAISESTLRDLVDLARLSASGGNLQPLKYILSSDPHRNAVIFPHLTWAAYIKEWRGPNEEERPTAYILVLNDTEIRNSCGDDAGIAVQSIMLGATELGLGGCIIGSIQRDTLRTVLNIPRRYEIILVLALGKPKEKIVVETADKSTIKYWRDDEGVHHVPKRLLDEIIINC